MNSRYASLRRQTGSIFVHVRLWTRVYIGSIVFASSGVRPATNARAPLITAPRCDVTMRPFGLTSCELPDPSHARHGTRTRRTSSLPMRAHSSLATTRTAGAAFSTSVTFAADAFAWSCAARRCAFESWSWATRLALACIAASSTHDDDG